MRARTHAKILQSTPCHPIAQRSPPGRGARSKRPASHKRPCLRGLPSSPPDDIPALPARASEAMRNPKNDRVKARLPRGFADRGAAEIRATHRMLERIRAVYENYGFEPVETPAIEYTDA